METASFTGEGDREKIKETEIIANQGFCVRR
uniref:Uncharacterized protein n=1 Tax=Anguilla anguilla TaxID=7936 RepID=A0A0E9PGH9_ANGAN